MHKPSESKNNFREKKKEKQKHLAYVTRELT